MISYSSKNPKIQAGGNELPEPQSLCYSICVGSNQESLKKTREFHNGQQVVAKRHRGQFKNSSCTGRRCGHSNGAEAAREPKGLIPLNL